MEDADEVSHRNKDIESVRYYSSESAKEEQDKRRENREELINRQRGLKIKIKALKTFRIIGNDGNNSSRRASLPKFIGSSDRKSPALADLPTKSTTSIPRGGIRVQREKVTCCKIASFSQAIKLGLISDL